MPQCEFREEHKLYLQALLISNDPVVFSQQKALQAFQRILNVEC